MTIRSNWFVLEGLFVSVMGCEILRAEMADASAAGLRATTAPAVTLQEHETRRSTGAAPLRPDHRYQHRDWAGVRGAPGSEGVCCTGSRAEGGGGPVGRDRGPSANLSAAPGRDRRGIDRGGGGARARGGWIGRALRAGEQRGDQRGGADRARATGR